MYRHHKGEDLMHNVENHSVKDSIFHFSGETFIDVEKYAARAKGNTKVFLTSSDRKTATMLQNKGNNQDQSAYM